jgi:hypothetical protein
MAAFRARNFGLGLARGCAIGADVGFDLWASCSEMLIVDFSSAGRLESISNWFSCCGGGLVSLTCGIPPAIDVSGIPTFRGGGGGSWVSNEYG